MTEFKGRESPNLSMVCLTTSVPDQALRSFWSLARSSHVPQEFPNVNDIFIDIDQLRGRLMILRSQIQEAPELTARLDEAQRLFLTSQKQKDSVQEEINTTANEAYNDVVES